MTGLIQRLTNWRAIGGLAVLYAIVFGAILITMRQLAEISGGMPILDFEPGYDTARVREVFTAYGVEGMALYGRIQVLDLVNPALYSLLAAALTAMLWPERPSVALLPLLAALGDYAENITLTLLARGFPDLPEGVVAVSSTLSLVKLALMAVGFAPLLIGLVLRLRR
ncbi:hypothetical protein [Nioella sp.]|uniref:hypothetical protein n=1 Tax=Nioella sp. TaxID=1912091 RepID=UPI003B52FF3F